MIMALLLSGSVTTFLLACCALGLFSVLAINAGERTRTDTRAKYQPVPRRAWKPVVTLLAIGLLVFFVLLTASFVGMQQIVVHRDNADTTSRQARYDACLLRTGPEVCEIHWVKRPATLGDE